MKRADTNNKIIEKLESPYKWLIMYDIWALLQLKLIRFSVSGRFSVTIILDNWGSTVPFAMNTSLHRSIILCPFYKLVTLFNLSEFISEWSYIYRNKFQEAKSNNFLVFRYCSVQLNNYWHNSYLNPSLNLFT